VKTPLVLSTMAAAAALILVPTVAKAVDVDAGDYTALPAGTNLGLAYYQHATRDRLYSQGNRLPINPGLDSDVGILRGVHFMELGGYVIDPQFLLPLGRLKGQDDTSSLGSASGVGDLILASTLWFNKAGEKENIGITPFLYLPTGKYDKNSALNLGENRWKFAFQGGWIKPLSDSVTMDLVADVTFYGKNKDFGPTSLTMKQKPMMQFQAMWRYHLSAASDLRFGLSQLTGGETQVEGVNQDDRTSSSKFWLGGSTFVGAKTQLLATYGRDISVRNGFKEDNRINLRLLQIF